MKGSLVAAIVAVLAVLAAPAVAAFAQGPAGTGSADLVKQKAAAVERARSFLAAKLDIPASRITLGGATAATWPDASLGCPEKDRMYAQVVTPGFRIVMKVDGRPYEVHVAGGRAVECGGKALGSRFFHST